MTDYNDSNVGNGQAPTDENRSHQGAKGTDGTRLPRRRFLQFVGTGVAATGLATVPGGRALAGPVTSTPGGATAAAPRGAALGNWKHVKSQFMIDSTITFMNVGTVGSPPRPVVRHLDQEHRNVAEGPLSGYGSYDAERAEIAPDYGCEQHEFAISMNTSDALQKIFAGIPWRDGDEIVTTNMEHSAGDSPLAMMRDRYGVGIKRVELPTGNDQQAEDYVELFREQISSNTKALFFSSPIYLTGTILPMRLLVDLAQEHELISIVDGAHLPGMFDLDLHALGMDFFAGPGAKWQCAPSGCGVLYVRNRVSDANPLPLPEFWPTISNGYHRVADDVPDNRADVDLGGLLTNIGNRNRAIFSAYVESCKFWNDIGRERIGQRVMDLSLRFKEQVAERWGVEALYSPKDDERLVSGLTTFNPFQEPSDIMDSSRSSEFVGRLESEYGYVIRNTTTPIIGQADPVYPMRVSTHIFHDEDDVDGAVEAMYDLSQQMA